VVPSAVQGLVDLGVQTEVQTGDRDPALPVEERSARDEADQSVELGQRRIAQAVVVVADGVVVALGHEALHVPDGPLAALRGR
jgi:hypothetical protein